MTKAFKIPPEIALRCSRLASEQLKPEVWRRAADLKHEFAQRLEQGEPLEDIEADLSARMVQAVKAQFLRPAKAHAERFAQDRTGAREKRKPKPERPPGWNYLHSPMKPHPLKEGQL